MYDVQMLKDKDTLAELDNNIVINICWLICQDPNQPFAEVAVTRLKLLSFWIKHQDQTLHEVGVTAKPHVRTTLVMINALREQMRLEDAWASENKEPDYIAITLDTSSATEAFGIVKTILTCIRGTTGVLLSMLLDTGSSLRARVKTLPLEKRTPIIPLLTRRQLPVAQT
jgi:hypothetical protein